MNSCFVLKARDGEGIVHVKLKADTFRRKHSTYQTTDYESSSKNKKSCTKLLDIISPQKPNNLKAMNMHVRYNSRCLLSYKCHLSNKNSPSTMLTLYYMGLSNNTLCLIDNGKKNYLKY